MSPPSERDNNVADLMRRFRSRDTRPELRVRSALHAMGLRYRVQRPVPSMPRRSIDIAFPSEKVAVFIDGCYWHSCPTHGKTPATNAEWWADKLNKNQQRDRETDRLLESLGWTVMRYWEHEDPHSAATQIAALVRNIRDSRDNGNG